MSPGLAGLDEKRAHAGGRLQLDLLRLAGHPKQPDAGVVTRVRNTELLHRDSGMSPVESAVMVSMSRTLVFTPSNGQGAQLRAAREPR